MRTRKQPTQESTTVYVEVPHGRKQDQFIRAYPIGDLIFWDRNLDGRFRWRDLDFITHKTGKRVPPGAKIIKATLQPLGLKRAFDLKDLSRSVTRLKTFSNSSESIKKTETKVQDLDASSEVIEDQLIDIEIAMEMGDFESLTAELRELKILLLPRGIWLPPPLISKMQDTTRMNFHFREAAALLNQGLPEMAAKEVVLALEYAQKLEIELTDSDIRIEIRSVPPFEISEAQVEDLMRFLAPGLNQAI